jgi:hypothetical protein
MLQRCQPRVNTVLPVRIWGVDANGRPFMQLATVRNISEQGLLVEGVRTQLKAGEVVDLQYEGRKAEFLVVWTGKQSPGGTGEIGLFNLPAQPCLWDGYLDRACELVAQG